MTDEKDRGYWTRIAQQSQQERLRERAEAAQDRADRLRAKGDENQSEETPTRRKGMRP